MNSCLLQMVPEKLYANVKWSLKSLPALELHARMGFDLKNLSFPSSNIHPSLPTPSLLSIRVQSTTYYHLLGHSQREECSSHMCSCLLLMLCKMLESGKKGEEGEMSSCRMNDKYCCPTLYVGNGTKHSSQSACGKTNQHPPKARLETWNLKDKTNQMI